jgi:hypothetical protein
MNTRIGLHLLCVCCLDWQPLAMGYVCAGAMWVAPNVAKSLRRMGNGGRGVVGGKDEGPVYT